MTRGESATEFKQLFHECQLFSEKLFLTFHPQTNFNVSRYMEVMWGKQQQMTLFRPLNSMMQKNNTSP